MKLKIAKGYTIDLTAPPFDTMGLRAFISGMSGAGKSYTQMKFIEEAYDAKLQFCLLDVHGEGHVLGELGDNVMVASDRFGIPVIKEAIPIYLEALENGMSLVVDLKPMFYEDETAFFEFLQGFLSKFMSLWSKVMTPILLCFDEAQEVMPQSPPKGIRELYTTVKKIVLGGRKSGVHYLLCSQRPALIDKTPISQANVRLFGKVEETADWDAIKAHVKGFTLDDMTKLRSGEFILSTEGEVTKVKILPRKTTDAGATPTFVPKFTDVQKVKMGDIASRIAQLIAKAKLEAAKVEDEKSLIKRLERQVETSKQREQELKTQLDTIQLIADKIGGKAGSSGGVDPKAVYEEVKEKFSKEVEDERKRHQRLIAEKDKTISDLEFKVAHIEVARKRIDAFRTAVSDILGDAPGSTYTPADIVTQVTAEVLKHLPASGGTYQVAPMEAFKLDWQKESMDKMNAVIDKLSEWELDVMAYLILVDKVVTVSAIAQSLLKNTYGSSRTQVSTALKPLKDEFLVRESKGNGHKQDIEGFVQHYVGFTTEDLTPFRERILERIRQRRNGK